MLRISASPRYRGDQGLSIGSSRFGQPFAD
jgi:hypothetical protein